MRLTTRKPRPARRALQDGVLATLILFAVTCGDAPIGIVPVASVVIQPDAVSLMVGATHQLTASARAADGTALADRAVAWTSSSPARATVSAGGRVTALATGRVVITATSEGVAGEAVVEVLAIPVAQVVVSPDSTTLSVGETVQRAARPTAHRLPTARSPGHPAIPRSSPSPPPGSPARSPRERR